jgi:hypothetical protein
MNRFGDARQAHDVYAARMDELGRAVEPFEQMIEPSPTRPPSE